MKQILYKGEIIAIVDNTEHLYLTDCAEELLRIFITDPCSDERCAYVEIRSLFKG